MDAILAAIDAALSEQQKKMQGSQTPVPARPLPPPVAPRAVAPAQPAPAPVPHGAAPAVRADASPLQGMFLDGNSLLRAIIAAEVLGPCVALRHAQDKPD